jgi:uncharacterized membrane protein
VVAEPIAVHEARWIWEKPGRYHGVPVTNFVGWFVTPFFILCACRLLTVRFDGLPGTGSAFAYIPALGYSVFLGICARVCRQRGLRQPARLGFAFAVLFFILYWIRVFFAIHPL